MTSRQRTEERRKELMEARINWKSAKKVVGKVDLFVGHKLKIIVLLCRFVCLLCWLLILTIDCVLFEIGEEKID